MSEIIGVMLMITLGLMMVAIWVLLVAAVIFFLKNLYDAWRE